MLHKEFIASDIVEKLENSYNCLKTSIQEGMSSAENYSNQQKISKGEEEAKCEEGKDFSDEFFEAVE